MPKLESLTLILGLLTFAFTARSTSQKLKVFISSDMEGITGVVHSEQVSPGGEYNIARKWMTEDVNAAVLGALDAGATEIIVNDSHGDMRNIILSDLHPAASLISGSPKPLGMMQGIDSTVDAVIFIGYHAKAGTQNAILDHTISSTTIYSIKINDVEMPELGINALIAGYYNAPVVMLAGDKSTCDQATQILGNDVVIVPVKEAVGRYAAKNLSLEKAHALIREQAKIGIEKRNQIKPYRLNTPYRFEVSFLRSSQADMAMLIPGSRRVDARSVSFDANDIIAGVKLVRAMITLGREN